MMACAVVHRRDADDAEFERCLPLIVEGSLDERTYVKKAVSWALRQIGKRNLHLNREAIRTAEQVRRLDARPARWIASDALRELTAPATQERLARAPRTRRSG